MPKHKLTFTVAKIITKMSREKQATSLLQLHSKQYKKCDFLLVFLSIVAFFQ